MRPRAGFVALFVLAVALAPAARAADGAGAAAPALRSPRDFESIADRSARSAALFAEASRALLHPRCLNCHPAGATPLQGNADRVHEPPIVRTKNGMGAVGMQCDTCHGRENYDPGRVPGAPRSHRVRDRPACLPIRHGIPTCRDRYSALMPASFTTRIHFAASETMNLPNSAELMSLTSTPSAWLAGV